MVYFGEKLFISADEQIKTYITHYANKCESELFRVFDAPNIFSLNNELEKYEFTIAHLAQYFLPDDFIAVCGVILLQKDLLEKQGLLMLG